ncbi:MAG: hypothetical protein H0W61_02290 [Bacteroidetes bacterium]|nr:hypothetical protein [Bacteroidota bacterium]
MKTKNFIPTLLALAIRVMVIGQTLNHHSDYRILNVLGNKQPSSPSRHIAKQQVLKQKSEAVLKDKSVLPASTVKVKPTVVGNDVSSVTTPKTDNNTYNYYNNKNCYSTLIYANELTREAEELLTIQSLLLKEAAQKKDSNEKGKLIQGARVLFLQAEIKQIQASEISGKLSAETFSVNETSYHTLLEKLPAELISAAVTVHEEAVFALKLAKEMREESYSLPNNTAKLGTMGNAEEKEEFALKFQNLAIDLLRKSVAAAHASPNSNLAVK